jgi:hypothetical protein
MQGLWLLNIIQHLSIVYHKWQKANKYLDHTSIYLPLNGVVTYTKNTKLFFLISLLFYARHSHNSRYEQEQNIEWEKGVIEPIM